MSLLYANVKSVNFIDSSTVQPVSVRTLIYARETYFVTTFQLCTKVINRRDGRRRRRRIGKHKEQDTCLHQLNSTNQTTIRSFIRMKWGTRFVDAVFEFCLMKWADTHTHTNVHTSSVYVCCVCSLWADKNTHTHTSTRCQQIFELNDRYHRIKCHQYELSNEMASELLSNSFGAGINFTRNQIQNERCSKSHHSVGGVTEMAQTHTHKNPLYPRKLEWDRRSIKIPIGVISRHHTQKRSLIFFLLPNRNLNHEQHEY